MRTYNKFEKKVIKTIIADYDSDSKNYVLANAYYYLLYDSKCEYSYGELHFYRNLDQVDITEILQLKESIIRVSLLLKHLIEKEYIYLITEKKPKPTLLFDIIDKEGLREIKVDISGDITNMIEKSFCNIVILQPLLDLEASDFKSVEEQQL